MDIEDEYHFLLVCDKFNNLRNKYVPRYFRNRPSMSKYVELMQMCMEDTTLCKNVAVYVYHAFKQRQ